MIIGIINTTIHAPSTNFVMTWRIETMPVAIAPRPLSAAFHFQLGPRVRRQCITIPACESVKQTNTDGVERIRAGCAH